MNRMSVTIVDFMAFLVPGVVLLFGLVLLPLPNTWLVPINDTLSHRMPILSNPWAAAVCWLLSAYVLGFLLRLFSIELMNLLTSYRWVKPLQQQAMRLAEPLEEAINNPKLITALNAISEQRNDRGVGKSAVYFHFAKRVVRTRPELWVEAERLEAEVRLAAGLFIPFVLLAIAGGWRAFLNLSSGSLLMMTGLIGAAIVIGCFPDRRIKEVLYDQLLAIIALRLPVDRQSPVEQKDAAQ